MTAEAAEKQFEEFKQTDDYKKWEKDYDDRDDDDMVRNDPDPQGWTAFISACKDPVTAALEIALKVAPANPQCAIT